MIPRSVTQPFDVNAQRRPEQPLVGVRQAQVGEGVAGAFLVLDAPYPSATWYSPLTLPYLRWLLFKTYPFPQKLHKTQRLKPFATTIVIIIIIIIIIVIVIVIVIESFPSGALQESPDARARNEES
jgi:hypothetical protein